MSRELDRLRKRTEKALGEADTSLKKYNQNLIKNVNQIKDEQVRVTNISRQAPAIIDNIEKQFKEKTKLSDYDVAFLLLATALQCARQYIFANDKFRIDAKQGDKLVEDILSPVPPSWQEVLTRSVPYDAIVTGAHISTSTELSGITHRYRTLGHDPILGWVFGTANIMTNSLTKYNFESYQVKNMTIVRHYPLGTYGVLNDAINYASQDIKILVAAVAAQALHFTSDYFTKQGLPVPIIMTIDNDLSKNMILKGSIDMYSITRGAALAALINQLIAIIHGLLYNEERDGSRKMYEVRTRKILSYSNALAVSSNAVVTAFTQNLNYLDVGGIIVALHRFISDANFIYKVKQDFLKDEIYNMIVGQPYDFMEGT